MYSNVKIAEYLIGKGITGKPVGDKGAIKFSCPAATDQDPSLVIYTKDDHAFCLGADAHGCGLGHRGDKKGVKGLVQFIKALRKVETTEAKEFLEGELPQFFAFSSMKKEDAPKYMDSRIDLNMSFEITDRDGKGLIEFRRKDLRPGEPKTMTYPFKGGLVHPDGKHDGPTPLFVPAGWDHLDSAKVVVVHQGPKDAAVATKFWDNLGIPVKVAHVSWAYGDSGFRRADLTPLEGKDIYIYPDMDQSGIESAQNFCSFLGRDIKIVREGRMEDSKEDFSDEYIKHHPANVAFFQEAFKNAQTLNPKSVAQVLEKISELYEVEQPDTGKCKTLEEVRSTMVPELSAEIQEELEKEKTTPEIQFCKALWDAGIRIYYDEFLGEAMICSKLVEIKTRSRKRSTQKVFTRPLSDTVVQERIEELCANHPELLANCGGKIPNLDASEKSKNWWGKNFILWLDNNIQNSMDWAFEVLHDRYKESLKDGKEKGWARKELESLMETEVPEMKAFFWKSLRAMVMQTLWRDTENPPPFDGFPIMHGANNQGKSKIIRAITGDTYVAEHANIHLMNQMNRGASCQGKMAIECPELELSNKRAQESWKRLVTSTHDETRQHYKHSSVKFYRRPLIFATTNNDKTLANSTERRRFWFIRITSERSKDEVTKMIGKVIDLGPIILGQLYDEVQEYLDDADLVATSGILNLSDSEQTVMEAFIAKSANDGQGTLFALQKHWTRILREASEPNVKDPTSCFLKAENIVSQLKDVKGFMNHHAIDTCFKGMCKENDGMSFDRNPDRKKWIMKLEGGFNKMMLSANRALVAHSNSVCGGEEAASATNVLDAKGGSVK